jgi:hypothetical protein
MSSISVSAYNQIWPSPGKRRAPMPTSSSVPAFCHFCKSPPLPQPMSSTRKRPLPFGIHPPINTLLTQLLNDLRPMMGDSRRALTSIFERLLSAMVTL